MPKATHKQDLIETALANPFMEIKQLAKHFKKKEVAITMMLHRASVYKGWMQTGMANHNEPRKPKASARPYRVARGKQLIVAD